MGRKQRFKLRHYRKAPAKAIAAAPASGERKCNVSEIRKLTSRWHRDELGAERKAARHLEASRAVLGLAAAARGATVAPLPRGDNPPQLGKEENKILRCPFRQPSFGSFRRSDGMHPRIPAFHLSAHNPRRIVHRSRRIRDK